LDWSWQFHTFFNDGFMNIVKSLEWRYATKRMNGQKISDSNLNEIQEAVRLSPSSIGLQPYKILVVSSPETKKKIAPTAYNQPQVLECSHLLVFTVWDRMTDSKAEEYLSLVQSERGVTRESLSTLVGYLDNLKKMSEMDFYHWASKQVYIALGNGMLAAASLEIDSTPMEGFNKEDLDASLELSKMGLRSVVLLALGYRDVGSDWLLKMKKVRRTKEELFLPIQ
jgi:nitroreductase/dihydropteridine reductase